MNVVQRILLVFSGSLILVGSLIILVTNANFSVLLSYFLTVIISTFFFYYAFSPSEKKNETRKVKTVIDIPSVGKNDKSNRALLIIKSIFLFDPFPDTLIIQEQTVSVVHKQFFFSGWAETVLIEDIFNVEITSGPFFSSLHIHHRTPNRSVIKIDNLHKKDSVEAKTLIDGLLLRKKGGMHIPENMKPDQKKSMLEKIAGEEAINKELTSS